MKKTWLRVTSVVCAAMLLVMCFGSALAQEQVTLTLLKAEAQNQEAWDALCEQYHEANPNVTVIVESYDNDLWSVLATRISSGELPDMFATQPYSSCVPYLEYTHNIDGTQLMADTLESVLPSLTFDTLVSGTCFYGDAEGIVYNKGVFAELGLEVPKTLDELTAVCEALTAAGYTPFSTAFKEGWVLQDVLSAFMGAEDDTKALTDAISAGERTFSDLLYKEELFDFIDIALKYNVGKPLETGYQDQCSDIGLGKAVMTTTGNWLENEALAIDSEIELGMFAIPISHTDASLAMLEVDPAWIYHVSTTGNVDESLKFYDWILTSAEGQRFIAEDIGKLPLLKGADFPIVGNTNADAAAAVAAGETRAIEQYFHPFGFDTDCAASLQQYIEGTKTRDAVLEELTATWVRLTATAK